MNSSHAKLLGIDVLSIRLSASARAHYDMLANEANPANWTHAPTRACCNEAFTELRRFLEATKHAAVGAALKQLADDDKAILLAEFDEAIAEIVPRELGSAIQLVGAGGTAIEAFEHDPSRRVLVGAFRHFLSGFRVPAQQIIFASLPFEGSPPSVRPLFKQLCARGHVSTSRPCPRITVALAEGTVDDAVMAVLVCEEAVATLDREGLGSHPAAAQTYRAANDAMQLARAALEQHVHRPYRAMQ